MIYSIKTIGEIFGDVKIGGTPPREKSEYFGGGLPWVSIKDMGKGKYVSETNETLSESGVQNSNVKLIKKGSLLFSFKLTVGRMCFAGTDLYTNEAIAAFEPNPEIILEYLYYVLPVATKQVKRTNNFGAPLLNKDQIKKLRIPLPPLETQKAIVAKLDQIFAELDQTKSEIQKNLDNTDELWKSALNQDFQGDWEMKKITDIADLKISNIVPLEDVTYNYIGLENIETNTGCLINFSPTIGKNIKSTKVVFKKGMVLYGKLRPYLNKVYVADFDGIATTEILPMNPKSNMNPKYLGLCLRRDKFMNAANESISGARMPRVTTKFLETYDEIPVPPLSEQEKIVEHLDQVSKEVKALKSQYQSQLDNLEELKKSVLDKAFRGELGE